ncbi:PREDICTED: protein TAPETUM DETERMINANT 1-like [Tarenaya hassleriana]|uniref:protein TAPETUM DETERMINANT 1-like n=1 Tax=Tarenaya hassleriana TaxID=28532 RepID=UPI00053C76B7|nr:PREDICTED: protein TAPETUM DETERMINANT 1-like [Tarenaya hassleriana]XP_010535236.1 PREDICTED: protein TAPETUM DETERMINANT 1-like [Tarenaya hassleriana]
MTSVVLCFLIAIPVVFSTGAGKVMEGGGRCRKNNIVISQESTQPLPNGIPTFRVEITNQCVTGCSISDIHLNCGWFSSATLIRPNVFKRLSYNDCLVNGGQPLEFGHTVSFQYATSFLFPLSVSSVQC